MPRIFRLFISSTFSDFIAEREALQQVVFPELETYCAKHGARFQAVDLRWGVTEEVQREHDTMRVCLEEVRRCQQLSPRPNFVVLLGDRYGWEPVPARIPMDHWERLLAAASPLDGNTIRSGYIGPNLNAAPPVMHLRKREGTRAANEEREATLRDALRRAVDQAGFNQDERLPYFASATHQEIALGALDTHDEDNNPLRPEEHVNVYVRRIEGLPNDASARSFVDWCEQRQAVVPGARQRLAELESELRERLPGKVHDIQARWNGTGTDRSHIDAFCRQFLTDQQAIIERELGTRWNLPEAESRNAQHQSFARERARNFEGRSDVLERISGYINQSAGSSPMIVHGSGGTGKSALMARAYLDMIEGPRNSAVRLVRFIGGIPGTESLMIMLTELSADIAAAYGKPAPPTPKNMKAARQAFDEALQSATSDRPLHLFLDALDQLDGADEACRLEWLPQELGEHTRIVASTREGNTLLFAQRRYEKSLLELPVMTPEEGELMLSAWLADAREAHYNAGTAPAKGRRLTPDQRKGVLDTFARAGKPLWLKLAYEEVRNWPSWKEPAVLPGTVETMVRDLITRRLLRGEHPHVFATRAMAYITAGRFGLAEEELEHALATDGEVKAEFDAQNARTGQKWEPVEKHARLPPILWSRLYFDLQPYLTRAQVDGTIVYRWFHREFKEEIGKLYLGEEKDKRTVHEHLAATFFERAPYGDKLFTYTDANGAQDVAALRRVMEQPWQLAAAHSANGLTQLLSDLSFLMAKAATKRFDDIYNDLRLIEVTNAHSTNHTNTKQLRRLRSELHWARWLGVYCPQISGAHALLQLALDMDETATLHHRAAQYIVENGVTWKLFLSEAKPSPEIVTPLIRILDGHAEPIVDAFTMADHELVTWSRADIKIWDPIYWSEISVFNCEDNSDIVSAAPLKHEIVVAININQSYSTLLKLDITFRALARLEIDPKFGLILNVMADSHSRIFLRSSEFVLETDSDFKNIKILDGPEFAPNVVTSQERIRFKTNDTQNVNLRIERQSPLALNYISANGTRGLWAWRARSAIQQFAILDDERCAASYQNGCIAIFRTGRQEPSQILNSHRNSVHIIRLLPCSRLLTIAHHESPRLWDISNVEKDFSKLQLDAETPVIDGKLQYGRDRPTSGIEQLIVWSYDSSSRPLDLPPQVHDLHPLTGDGEAALADIKESNRTSSQHLVNRIADSKPPSRHLLEYIGQSNQRELNRIKRDSD
jgi:hypothetical protein